MLYPVTLLEESDGFTVTFPDIPEAITGGTTRAEALEQAKDALESALDFYFEDNRHVPAASAPRRGQALVELPASVSAKVLLHNELLAQAVRPADLARRLKTTRQEVNRLLDPRHATKIDSIQLALGALGKHIHLVVSSTQVSQVRSDGAKPAPQLHRLAATPLRKAVRPARAAAVKAAKKAR